MDIIIQKAIGALQIRIREQLQSLGDFPKVEPFEHGVQVGTYQGLQKSIDVLEQVLNDELDVDSRR